MKIAYPARFEPQPEGGFTVTFPDLSEAITEGDTLDQARFNAAECLSLALDVRMELGVPYRKPLSSKEWSGWSRMRRLWASAWCCR
jgi:antitoxin HicB